MIYVHVMESVAQRGSLTCLKPADSQLPPNVWDNELQ